MVIDWADFRRRRSAGLMDERMVDGKEVEERIDELRGLRAEAEDSGVRFDAELRRELELLLHFHAEFRRIDPGGDGEIVPDGVFREYIIEQARQEYGAAAEELNDFIDWGRYVEAQRRQFTEVTFDGITVWVRGDA